MYKMCYSKTDAEWSANMGKEECHGSKGSRQER